jgi:hypothetical protein
MKFADLQLLPDDDSPKAVRAWRIRLAIVACSSSFLIFFLVLPAMFSELPRLGSLAWAQDVDSKIAPLQQSVNDIKELMLENAILSAQKNWCDAYAKGESATAWSERIRELNRQYFKIVGRAFAVPDCRAV